MTRSVVTVSRAVLGLVLLIGGSRCCGPGGVDADLLLSLGDVLLVADPLVAEPVVHLRDRDAALPGQLLLGLFARVRVAEVRVEVLVQDLRGCLAEVATLPSGTMVFQLYVKVRSPNSFIITVNLYVIVSLESEVSGLLTSGFLEMTSLQLMLEELHG